MAEPLPDGIADLIPAAIASVERRLEGIGPEGLAVRMQAMWDAGVPQPEPVTLAQWYRLLSGYPDKVVTDAFDELIKTHVWPRPPKIADVMKHITPAMERLQNWRRKLNRASTRAELDAKQAVERAKREDQSRARVEERLAAMSDEDRAAAEAMLAAIRAGGSAAEAMKGI